MYLLFDIGGSKMRVAYSQDGKSFEKPYIIKTPAEYNKGISLLRDIKTKLIGKKKLQAVVGSVAASFDTKHSKLIGGGAQLKNWLEKLIQKDIENSLECPVYIANDAMMGGLAQSYFGPARGHKISVYVTVSTGVGGAIIVDRKIDDNTFGFEPGWQIIDAGNQLCAGWSKRGYLIDYISGTSIKQNMGKNPEDIIDNTFWESRADFLAMGLHNITTMWSPSIITVGGGVMRSINFEYLKKRYRENIEVVFPIEQPILKQAEFGDEMGLYGALAYIKTYKF